MSLSDFLLHSDLVSRVLAVLLLALSVSSWVVILWKWRLLARVQLDVRRSVAAFWQAPGFDAARHGVAQFDRDACVAPLLEATLLPVGGTLASSGDRQNQLTRVLRDALQQVVRRLQWGQLLLATAGSISPFVGLLGTVWGIFNALTGMAEAGQLTIDKVAGPVGEALVMTAAGLAVAIPAVLGYNLLGRRIALIEAELEGFAHDVRGLLADPQD
ncbi:flagellar motor protein MotA [Limnohabitans sp. MMS-10A-160]|jgi:biopolymer transport protein ExbB|uniref:MotA/TolQ/ExbB proton channel family protein n=1 Tax=unclassified Limnohabitans TaxID=2626134 RepID=UPI000D3CB3EF|nr:MULTISPECIES: MotA/TolQ/ExbB proton channel family protein [unclassified Limnohabitans]PUE20772.1 flagellar motor protein MotA [Limnohabitans sp. MMS-10A-192]PUE24842.1 flagellar motor protein MotA [Limnohabitans sp. MMS-10A-160]